MNEEEEFVQGTTVMGKSTKAAAWIPVALRMSNGGGLNVTRLGATSPAPMRSR